MGGGGGCGEVVPVMRAQLACRGGGCGEVVPVMRAQLACGGGGCGEVRWYL